MTSYGGYEWVIRQCIKRPQWRQRPKLRPPPTGRRNVHPTVWVTTLLPVVFSVCWAKVRAVLLLSCASWKVRVRYPLLKKCANTHTSVSVSYPCSFPSFVPSLWEWRGHEVRRCCLAMYADIHVDILCFWHTVIAFVFSSKWFCCVRLFPSVLSAETHY